MVIQVSWIGADTITRVAVVVEVVGLFWDEMLVLNREERTYARIYTTALSRVWALARQDAKPRYTFGKALNHNDFTALWHPKR